MSDYFEDGQIFSSTEEMIVALMSISRAQSTWIAKIARAISADEQGEETIAAEKLKEMTDELYDKIVADLTIMGMEKLFDSD